MIKLFGVALCTLFSAIFLRNYNKTLSIILSIVGSSIVFLICSESINSILNELLALSQNYSSTFGYIKLMIKILGITIISQFVSDLCRENGEIALSSVVGLVSKITVITLVLPLFEIVINIIVGLVK